MILHSIEHMLPQVATLSLHLQAPLQCSINAGMVIVESKVECWKHVQLLNRVKFNVGMVIVESTIQCWNVRLILSLQLSVRMFKVES